MFAGLYLVLSKSFLCFFFVFVVKEGIKIFLQKTAFVFTSSNTTSREKIATSRQSVHPNSKKASFLHSIYTSDTVIFALFTGPT